MQIRSRFSSDKAPVYLVDGSSFLYRGFYAYPDLKRSDGFPTNAIFIVLRILMRIMREEQPEFLGFFLDGKGKNFRHELYDDYKANRPRMPEPLAEQVDPLKEAVSLMGLNVTVSEGVEADDCIASLAARFKGERPVIIVGSDKDLRQCLDDSVVLWDPAGKKEKLVTLEDFREETGLEPAQWPDVQALTGDSSDNIPGLRGVGPKTALKVMADFPTLEDIRDNADALPKSFRAKLEGNEENIFLYRELTRMKTDACEEQDLDDYRVQPMDLTGFGTFLKTYEFRSLLRDLTSHYDVPPLDDASRDVPPAAAGEKPGKQAQASLFGSPAPSQPSLFADAPKRAEGPKLDITRVDSADALPKLSGKDVGVVPGAKGYFLGIDQTELQYLGKEAELVEALTGAATVIVPSWQDLMRQNRAWDALQPEHVFDLSLAAYLLNPEDRNYDWDRLRSSLFQDSPDFTDLPEVHPDAQGLAALAWRDAAMPKLASAKLDALMQKLETPLIPVLVGMEREGIGIDRTAFTEFLDEVGGQLEQLTKDIHEQAGKTFNIRSSQQLAEILFEELELPPAGKTPGGAYSTANQVLEKLKGKHPIVDSLMEYRMLEKLRSTYLEPMPKRVDKHGRLHTHFNQLATATGRLSSSGPNLQNIPIRGPQGKRMRACFAASDGNLLTSADYSQVELRVLAHFSKDPALVQAFKDDEDIHARTAALLFDRDSAGSVTDDERRNAKTVNFGLIYGMGPQKLARELSITLKEAKEFIERYFQKLPTLKDYYESIIEDAMESGWVTTLAGRRRLLPELHSRNNMLASQAKRQAVNTVIQGSAADIIKLAMLDAAADEDLRSLGARLILQVHDELLLETPQDTAEQAARRLSAIMRDVRRLDVPLKVDAGTGRTWADAH